MDTEPTRLQQMSPSIPKPPTPLSRFFSSLYANNFLLGIIFSIMLALAYPKLGAVYLFPSITSTYIAVIYIFLMSGISLKSHQLMNAFSNIRFNLFVQFYNLILVSMLTVALTKFLLFIDATTDELADGMVITASLPMTINMVIVLTIAAGGDEASAVFNAAVGNLLGVFITPALVLLFLNSANSISFANVLFKLSVRVLLPLVVGQLIQYKAPPIKDYVDSNKPLFKKSQELTLTYIVYTTFCTTFYSDSDPDAAQADLAYIIVMGVILTLHICFLMGLSWYTFGYFYKDEPELRVFALFGGTHKTLSMGIPLLSAMFEGDQRLGLFTLPILVWHPVQLILGSMVTPRLKEWAEAERGRLGPKVAAVVKQEDDGDVAPNNVL